MRIASVYGVRIQWRLYEAVRIQRLRVLLEVRRDLFRLEFPLWALREVNSPQISSPI